MKKVMALLVIGIVLVSLVIFYKAGKIISEEIDTGKQAAEDKITDNEVGELSTTTPQTSDSTGSSGGGGSSTGAAGGGTGGEAAEGTNESGGEVQLPEDIETRPCGFYFGEYESCVGVCPAGTCQQEGRSCYCKF